LAAVVVEECRARLVPPLFAAAARAGAGGAYAGTMPEFGGVLTGGRLGPSLTSCCSCGGPPPAVAGVAIFFSVLVPESGREG